MELGASTGIKRSNKILRVSSSDCGSYLALGLRHPSQSWLMFTCRAYCGQFMQTFSGILFLKSVEIPINLGLNTSACGQNWSLLSL